MKMHAAQLKASRLLVGSRVAVTRIATRKSITPVTYGSKLNWASPNHFRLYAAAADTDEMSEELEQVETNPGPYQIGDIVVGRIVSVETDGYQVQMLDDPSTTGLMPDKEGPVAMLDYADNRKPRRKGVLESEELYQVYYMLQERLPVGMVREFKIIRSAHDGKEMLVSAKSCDRDRLWTRADQILDISTNAKENFSCKVESTNSGGLLTKVAGLSLFIPASHVDAGSRKKGRWQDLAPEYEGENLVISIVEVDRSKRKIVGSVAKAKENDHLRELEVGKLIKGTIRRIEDFGVFVGIQGTKVSGLLHISNISRRHVDHPSSVFSVGEKVYCIVMAMDVDYSDISLCTSELEINDGDMMTNKEEVWATAEETASQFSEHLASLRESGYEF